MFLAFRTSNYRPLQTQNKMRLNVCVNGMAPFELFASITKGKTPFDSNGSKGGLPTRHVSGPARYECVPH